MNRIASKDIHDAVRRSANDILEWTCSLIRLPSENRPPIGAEGPAQAFVAAECDRLQLDVDVFLPNDIVGIEKHAYWLAGRDYAGRQNVVARWQGNGGGRSILFSGHVDVAPFEPDRWTQCRPFEPVVKKDRLYGRGSADMKGGLAAAFWAIRILKELGFHPAGDVLFESVVDEEFAGGNGTLAARLKGYNADLAIVPEPTQMQVCPACMGAFLGDIVLSGRGGMPYTGSVIANPLEAMSRVIAHFGEWRKQWMAENRHPLFESPGSEAKVLLWHIESANRDEFVQMGTPTEARLSWIVWCYPGMTGDEFDRRFGTFWEHCRVSDDELRSLQLKIERTYHTVRPWQTPTDHPAVGSVVDACRKGGIDSPTISGAPFSCDLSIYGDVGRMPCVLLGPRGDHLHAPDEWVCTNDILQLVEIYAQLIVEWSGSRCIA